MVPEKERQRKKTEENNMRNIRRDFFSFATPFAEKVYMSFFDKDLLNLILSPENGLIIRVNRKVEFSTEYSRCCCFVER